MLNQSSIKWISLIIIMTSCVYYTPVVDKNTPPNEIAKKVQEEIEVGDWVRLKIYNNVYYNLEVMHIDQEKIVVVRHSPDRPDATYEIYLQYVQELTIMDTEITYPIGGPLTALIILMYLLV